MKEVKTQGGKCSTCYIGSNGYFNKTGPKLYRYLASRYAKTKLKKGEVIYLYLSAASGSKNATSTLKIKQN